MIPEGGALLDHARRILMNDDLGARKAAHTSASTASVIRCASARLSVAVQLQMELDELITTRCARAQIVEVENLRMRAHDLLDPGAVGFVHLAVHQHVERILADPQRRARDEDGDGKADGRVDPPPAELRAQHQGRDHADIDQEVGGVVRLVGADGDRAGAPDDVPLQQHQQAGDDERDHHHRDAGLHRRHRRARPEAIDDLHRQHHRRAEDEGDLHQAGQRLRLAMAEAMLGIRRHQGLADGDEIDDRGRGIERGIEQARQHADRAGLQEGAELERDQEQRRADRREAGEPHQPGLIGGRRDRHG